MVYFNHALNRTWKYQWDTSPIFWVTWAPGLIDSYQYTLTGTWKSCPWKKAGWMKGAPPLFLCGLPFPLYPYWPERGELASKRLHIAALLLKLILRDIMKPVAYGRERSFRFPFNANVSICLWIEVGSQMPIPGERIKCLKNKSPIFPRVADPLEGEGLLAPRNTGIAYLSVPFNRELWKKNGN